MSFTLKVQGNGNYCSRPTLETKMLFFDLFFFFSNTRKTVSASDPGSLQAFSFLLHLSFYFPQTAPRPYLAAPTGPLKYHERFELRQAWTPATDFLLFFMLFIMLYCSQRCNHR